MLKDTLEMIDKDVAPADNFILGLAICIWY